MPTLAWACTPRWASFAEHAHASVGMMASIVCSVTQHEKAATFWVSCGRSTGAAGRTQHFDLARRFLTDAVTAFAARCYVGGWISCWRKWAWGLCSSRNWARITDSETESQYSYSARYAADRFRQATPTRRTFPSHPAGALKSGQARQEWNRPPNEYSRPAQQSYCRTVCPHKPHPRTPRSGASAGGVRSAWRHEDPDVQARQSLHHSFGRQQGLHPLRQFAERLGRADQIGLPGGGEETFGPSLLGNLSTGTILVSATKRGRG